MDNVDRDDFYSAGADDCDDDGTEYEVEPPDPDVLAAEERRAAEIVAASQLAIDVDDIYNEAEGRRDREFLDQLVHSFRFRFRTKHLLVATAVVAVVVAVAAQQGFAAFFVLAALVVVGGITAYLAWKQEQREAELQRRRHQVYAERRTRVAQQDPWRQHQDTPDDMPEEDEPEAAPAEQKKFRHRFTLAEMMSAVACAVVLFGLVATWGLAETATLVGFVALGGLVLHAIGFEPPYAVALGWWVLLLLYVVLSIVAAIWSSLQT